MRKNLCILLVLCGLMMLFTVQSIGSVRASGLSSPPIQVQNSGYTDSRGTMTVTTACPLHYQAKQGVVQVTTSSEKPTYTIKFNGPNAQRTAWVVTAENQAIGTLSLNVTVTCSKG